MNCFTSLDIGSFGDRSSMERASLVGQLVKNPPVMQETWVRSLVGKIPWRRGRLLTPLFQPGEFHGL